MPTLSLKKPSPRAQQILDKKRQNGKRTDQETWQRLQRDHPQLFDVRDIKPFQISLGEQLIRDAPVGGRKSVRRVLARWCARLQYQEALVRGGDRYGLNGKAGTVTDEQMAHAAEKVERKRMVFARRKQLKAQQPRIGRYLTQRLIQI